MKTQLTTLAMTAALSLLLSSAALASNITINVSPDQVPDETEPRVNFGDAPAGYGPDSWQGPATGKSNYNVRYAADGDALTALFPVDALNLTINDLASLSYFTERPTGTPAGRDWWVQIYTRPTGSGDNASWYHDRFINNYQDHTSIDTWTQYSTGAGMTFHSNGLGVVGESTLAQLQAAVGGQLIEMISVQTDSGWNGFDGYMDGLAVALNNGNIGQVNFVPEPSTLALAMAGAVGLFAVYRRRRRSA